jgi:hypothetical protein
VGKIVRSNWVAVACAISVTIAACGGSSPTSPSQSGSGSGSTTGSGAGTTPTGSGGGTSSTSCRTGVATYRIVTTSASFTSTINGSCTFNPSTVEGTCTNNYTDTLGSSFTSVSVTRHATRGDVVDEVSVIPPLNRALGTTTTITGAGPTTTNTATLGQDGQRRLVSITAVSQPSGQTTTTTYTAWDSAGRPTAGTVVGAGQPIGQTFSYDNASRTQTSASSGVTCTQTFDQNGNPSVGTCPGSTATMTVLTTQQICR